MGSTTDAAAIEGVSKVITEKAKTIPIKPSGPVVTKPITVVSRGKSRG
jgi:hypothetical protein